MRYAIPVSGGALAAHFGHCEQFALIDADETSRQILKKETVDAPPHEPGLLPRWLAEKGTKIVIAGGMGPRAIEIFQQNNIDVIIGVTEPDPEKAVLSHLNGTLAGGQNICDH